MAYTQPARTRIYRTRIRWMRVAALLAVIAAITAVLGHQLLASSPTPSTSSRATSPVVVRGSEPLGALSEADGAVPDGTTVFDGEVPGVAKLDSALLTALRQAATDAARDGVTFVV